MADNKLSGGDYLLLLLYLDDRKPINGAVRLTKMMFLFDKEIQPELKKKGLGSEKLPDFLAYNFGPFSKDLYELLEFFQNIQFIKTTDRQAEDMSEIDDWNGEWFDDAYNEINCGININSKYMKYELNDLGSKYVEEKILPNLTGEQQKILEQFKTKIVNTTAKNILRYVYTKYPDYAINSLIKAEITGDSK
jgi:hypothetical protein